ncbi:MAG: Mur ligase family protein [Methanobacteriaceae archaeon]|nr:Mur ligase family protein [Methanobacteriaceae archaeon]
MTKLKTSLLAQMINGNLYGPDHSIKGIFNFLNSASPGDAVIRYWIDEIGVKIAAEKNVSCIITEDPRGHAIDVAEEMGVSLITVKRIEIANAFALKWAVESFANNSKRVVVTGTNGKSTTAHLLYNILNEAGFSTYCNTDAQSEFNTLIDPMVSKQIAQYGQNIEYLVIEVSEVQGLPDRLMENHAYMMTEAVSPDVVVVTNIALDHVNLVKSIDEMFKETSGSIKALNKGVAVLNALDSLVFKMKDYLTNNEYILFGKGDLYFQGEGIYYDDKLLIKENDLPFKSQHFICNIMAAVGAAIALGIDNKSIKKGIVSYQALDRRFSILNQNPLIIDDFAHNPDGIMATIKNIPLKSNSTIIIVSAIRGSRGREINQLNAKALIKGLKTNILRSHDFKLVITSSIDVVDQANTVTEDEKESYLEELKKENINFLFRNKLYDAIKFALSSAHKNDTILLIGAQGMDPAQEVVKSVLKELEL